MDSFILPRRHASMQYTFSSSKPKQPVDAELEPLSRTSSVKGAYANKQLDSPKSLPQPNAKKSSWSKVLNFRRRVNRDGLVFEGQNLVSKIVVSEDSFFTTSSSSSRSRSSLRDDHDEIDDIIAAYSDLEWEQDLFSLMTDVLAV